MATSILYGWGLTMISVLLGLITLNIVYAKDRLLLYPTMIATGILVLSFLVATLSSALGVLVSLRASTVRQAQQTFSIAFFILFIPLFLIPLLPEMWKIKMMSYLLGINFEALIILIALLLVVLNVVLIGLAMARFKRAKMIFA
jgi:ABC-2 type transport system permease protein